MSLSGRLAASGLLLFAATTASADTRTTFNLQTPVTPVAELIYDLHTLMMIICFVIFVAVFGVMFYSIFKHRKSKGAVPAHFHENTMVEILWTVIPVFILVGMAWPATKTILEMRDTTDSEITIKATGYQWQWGYDYMDGEGQGISFMSALSTPRAQIEGREEKGENYLLEVDNPLVVPVGQKIRMLIAANDVIHSWWVPAFGVKQDAIPGFIRETWFRADREGTFRGVCAELCGRDHAYMPIVVHVVSEEEYADWVETQQNGALDDDDAAEVATWSHEELIDHGESVYASSCTACHQQDGSGNPPAFPAMVDNDVVLDDDIEPLLDVILNGRPGTAMSAFGGQLSDADVAAVSTYMRNSWGNEASTVEPSDVADVRD